MKARNMATIFAVLAFREKLSKRLIVAIVLVTAASLTLSFEGTSGFRFNIGSLLVLGAAFLGVLFGVVLLREEPGIRFYMGLAIMMVATVLLIKDTIFLQHTHEHSHSHTHAHCHVHTHTHIHGEDEAAHSHTHESIEGHEHAHSLLSGMTH